MRTIKFRAWDKDKKEIIYLQDTVSCWSQWGDEILPYCNGPHSMFDLMQFTGLLDKNRKEIYEGDIVKYDWKDPMAKRSQRIGAVKWCEKYCDYRITTSDDMWKSALDMLEFEVIGNIYEHPSLLDK